MRKAIYYIFLISAIIAFVCGMEVTIMLSRAIYYSGDHLTAFKIWLAPLYWLCLLTAILLWCNQEKWVILPLLIAMPDALRNAYLDFRYNGWPTDFSWWCNKIAIINALIMIISGFAYYAILIIRNRNKLT